MSHRRKNVTFSDIWCTSLVTLPPRKNPEKATSIAAKVANSADSKIHDFKKLG